MTKEAISDCVEPNTVFGFTLAQSQRCHCHRGHVASWFHVTDLSGKKFFCFVFFRLHGEAQWREMQLKNQMKANVVLLIPKQRGLGCKNLNLYQQPNQINETF